MPVQVKLGKLLFQEDDVLYEGRKTVGGEYKRLFGVDYRKESTKVLADFGDNEYIETPHAIVWISACNDSAIYELPSNDSPSEDWEKEAPVDAPKVDVGGYAFPHSYANGEYVTDGGMSLMDYFAGQALIGVMTIIAKGNPIERKGEIWRGSVEELAYIVAKDMIKQRRKVLDGCS